ncbi:MAG: type II secretion system F family protein [Dehalococcoidia bacterium]
MPYKYVAYDSDGKTVEGTLDVAGQWEAEEALKKAGYTAVSIKKARKAIKMEEVFPSLYGIKTEDVINFSRQLATLLEAGLTLPQALQLLEAQVERASFRKVVAGLRGELEGGSSFSDALAKYPNAFNNIYIHMAAAGEQSGDLALSLRQAVNYIERGQLTIKKVKRALTYPSVILIVALLVILILVTYVLPELMAMFDKMDVDLPLATQILKNVSDFAKENVLLIFIVVIGAIVGIVLFMRTGTGQRFKDKALLKIPLIKIVVLQSNLALFTRTGSTLMMAGVALPRIMDIVTQVTPNSVIRDALKEVHEGLLQGHGLARPLAMNALFPPLLVQMITVGEQTGTMDTSMENVATFYDSEVDNRLDQLTSMLEPIIVVFIAVAVGFIAISVISPMYTVLGGLE